MLCPKCRNTTLKRITVKGTGVKVDRCSRCRGIWFDAEELEAVLHVAAKELAVPSGAEKSTSLSCMRCDSPLFRFEYPQTYVQVDMCKKCRGLWLDSGELTEIKVVRRSLQESGDLEKFAPVTGAKGHVLRFIDTAIEALMWK